MVKSPIAVVVALAAFDASIVARVLAAPMLEAASIHGVGARVEEPAIGPDPPRSLAGPGDDRRRGRP